MRNYCLLTRNFRVCMRNVFLFSSLRITVSGCFTSFILQQRKQAHAKDSVVYKLQIEIVSLSDYQFNVRIFYTSYYTVLTDEFWIKLEETCRPMRLTAQADLST